MKKNKGRPPVKGDPDRDTMLPEYDFSKGVRGATHLRCRAGTNVILLDPDVAKAFKTSAAVNRALRRMLKAKAPASRRKRTA
jgi:hypothetical protein